MIISFNSLTLHNFKNHSDLRIPFSEITRILGTNGAGKSTVGEAITWTLYGADPLGNTLIKALSPEPTNYEFDYVSAQLLLSVDDKQVLLERRIEDGETKYLINEIPAKATAYKELVESLFDKTLFLSLFSPAYFFSQKWEDQLALLLKNVLPPASSEVFKFLPKPQADKLAELLKKHSLTDLEAKHKDNKNRQDKALIAAKERVKTLQEQIDQLPPAPSADEAIKLNEQVAAIDAKITKHELAQKAANERVGKIAKLEAELAGIKRQADDLRDKHTAKRASPPDEACDKCKRPFDAESLEAANAAHKAEIQAIRNEHAELLERHSTLRARLDEIRKGAADFDPDELRLLQQTRFEIINQLKAADDRERLQSSLDEARQKEKEIDASYKDSVFVLDAIKAFRAKEADLMADKITDLFETLTIQLYQENKGDGERKPFFEVYKDGKPYRKLSTAEKIKAGLEMIDVLSQQSGVVAPVFIDNAESILSYKQPVGQLIECRVADQDFTIQEVK